jgi:hypothetical protein
MNITERIIKFFRTEGPRGSSWSLPKGALGIILISVISGLLVNFLSFILPRFFIWLFKLVTHRVC